MSGRKRTNPQAKKLIVQLELTELDANNLLSWLKSQTKEHRAPRTLSAAADTLELKLGSILATFRQTACVPDVETLKEREIEILKMLDAGYANKEIARTLAISVDTVKWYLKEIFAKLGVTRRTHACSEARRLNILF